MEWAQERDYLWRSVSGVTESYMIANKAGIEAADFKGILPLHPMAAFLLKTFIGSDRIKPAEHVRVSERRGVQGVH